MMMNDGSRNGNGNGEKKSMPRTNNAQNIALFCLLFGVMFFLVFIMSGMDLGMLTGATTAVTDGSVQNFSPDITFFLLACMMWVGGFLFFLVSWNFYFMINTNIVYNQDCIKGMAELDSDSINLIVTSPPYFVKKSYEKDWNWEKFDLLMKNIFIQAERILSPGCYFVLNFGDNGFGRDNLGTECISTYPMTHYYWEIKGGLELQATRVWRKQFAKVPFNGQARFAPRNLFDYEHIWTFRKKDGIGKEKVRNIKKSCRGVLGEDWLSKAGLNIHCAAFPIELPMWAIEVYSDEKDIVLDPFLGSGTTAIAARKLNRKYIGFEINSEYFEIAKNRLQTEI